MLRQLRALFQTESPLPSTFHFHLDDEGRKVWCDESICRPAPRRPDLFLLHRW